MRTIRLPAGVTHFDPIIGPLTERSRLHPDALNASDLRVGMMIMCHQGFNGDPARFYLVLGLPFVDGAGDTRARMFKTYNPDEDIDPEAVRSHPGYGFLAADYWLNNMGLVPHVGIPEYWDPNSYTLLYEKL